jgi:hypothetical protein
MRSFILAALLIALVKASALPEAEGTMFRTDFDACSKLTVGSQPTEATAKQSASDRTNRFKGLLTPHRAAAASSSQPANTENN